MKYRRRTPKIFHSFLIYFILFSWVWFVTGNVRNLFDLCVLYTPPSRNPRRCLWDYCFQFAINSINVSISGELSNRVWRGDRFKSNRYSLIAATSKFRMEWKLSSKLKLKLKNEKFQCCFLSHQQRNASEHTAKLSATRRWAKSVWKTLDKLQFIP